MYHVLNVLNLKETLMCHVLNVLNPKETPMYHVLNVLNAFKQYLVGRGVCTCTQSPRCINIIIET